MDIAHAIYTSMVNALHGMASPFWIGVALALTTLLLEDVAIAAGVAVATQGALSWEWAFTAVAGGIALGDLSLYAIGLGATRISVLRRKYIDGRNPKVRTMLQRSLPNMVLLARVIPGLRLLTYTACGFWRIPMLPFTFWVLIAVLLWTAGLFWLSSKLGHVFAKNLNLPLPIAVALPIILLALLVPLWHWLRGTASSSSS
jgi:membrane protein DedA with SNARE-associated domain